jgi:LTXXQ motif family protein
MRKPAVWLGSSLVILLAMLAPVCNAAPHRGGGGPHFGGAPHFSAPAAHFAAPHFAAPHFRAAPHFAAPHFAAHRFTAAPHFNRVAPHVAHIRPHVAGVAHANRSVLSRTFHRGNVSAQNRHANRFVARNAHAVHSAFNGRQVSTALHHPTDLRNPHTRSVVTAAAATAAWHSGHEWWRHHHGGFGWVGPIFWPFAYYDWYDYVLWGYPYYADAFWDYGYGDIYAALFTPYDYDELVGYLPPTVQANAAPPVATPLNVPANSDIAQLCGTTDAHDIAGLPIDQIRQALQLNDQQQVALNDLAKASGEAAQVIKAACPAQIPLTAPGRIDVMQSRVEAMIQAIDTVQAPLDKFYALLSDQQKARLNALGEENGANNQQAASSPADLCGSQQALSWPADEISRAVHPNGEQRGKLDRLQRVAMQADHDLQTSCPSSEPITPTARLAAAKQRLETLLGAIKTVHTALNDFYGSLSDEQKAQFDAIGPQRTARS